MEALLKKFKTVLAPFTDEIYRALEAGSASDACGVEGDAIRVWHGGSQQITGYGDLKSPISFGFLADSEHNDTVRNFMVMIQQSNIGGCNSH